MSAQKYEFATLFKDEERTQLFAMFCIYPNTLDPSEKSYIEHWAFVDENVQDLYNSSFYVESQNTPPWPTNREEWLGTLNQYPRSFKSFMHRKSVLFEYDKEPNNISIKNTIFKDFDVSGDRTLHINLDGKKDWIIIQEKPWIIGGIKNFYQLSLLKTLQNDNGGCFSGQISFSDVINIGEEKSFKDFVSNNGLDEHSNIKLPRESVKYAIFSEVISSSITPTSQVVPEDSLLIIPTTKLI